MNRSLRKRLDRLAGQKPGVPQFAEITFDSLAMTDDQAVEKAFEAGYIPPGCVFMVFPKTLTPEQWESMIPIWNECIRTGSKWDEVPYWASGGAAVPKLKFDEWLTSTKKQDVARHANALQTTEGPCQSKNA